MDTTVLTTILLKELGIEWFNKLSPFLLSDEGLKIFDTLREKNKSKKVVPLAENVFKAFKECPYDKMKVVIIALDPYIKIVYDKPEACGLAFSYEQVDKLDSHVPKSLKIILKEVADDYYGGDYPPGYMFDTDLRRWANQGVLLLNSALTTEIGKTGEHLELWKPFTEFLLKTLNEVNSGLIYCLWGKDAQKFKKEICPWHYTLEAPHPAAELYSGGKAGFYGCKHFTKINELIIKDNGKDYCIKW